MCMRGKDLQLGFRTDPVLFVCILLGEEKYEQKNKKRIYVPYTFIYSIKIS